jgi:hypothetical protein
MWETGGMNSDFMADLLQHLHSLKEFPKYQYERRIDTFVGFFLRPVLHARPEFPLKAHEEKRLSNNADYAVLDGQTKTAWLVELKADATSVSKKQISYYTRALLLSWPQLIKEIRWIAEGTTEKSKYDHLLEALKPQGEMMHLRALYLAPESARTCFQQRLDEVVSELDPSRKEVASRWQFMSLRELADTDIETSHQDVWRVVANELGNLK